MFDEVYGFLPPHPANPPTKRPPVALMKQARGFGVGVVVATQNPMDLDYRALSNAGLRCLGRLQSDADRARVLDGLAAARGTEGSGSEGLGNTLQRLAPRWFVVRNAHASSPPIWVNPRYAMSLMRGPMTRVEIWRARGVRDEASIGSPGFHFTGASSRTKSSTGIACLPRHADGARMKADERSSWHANCYFLGMENGTISQGCSSQGSRRATAWLPALLVAMPLLGCEYYDMGDAINGPGSGHGHSGGGKKGCDYGGAHYRPGDSFPSSDGCNQCSCQANGSVLCTLRACAATCGGLAGLSCPEGQYCRFAVDAQCGAADQTGSCAVRPDACTKEFVPVCGCDGVTYGNACVAASAGVSVASQGECGSGSDALQIGDACGGFRPPNSPDCDQGLFCQHQPGALCGAADAPGECVAIPELCTDIFDPVCGCDGQTYPNACQAAVNQMGIFARGECQ